MGNSCFCDNIHFIKDVKLNVCFQRQDITSKSDQILVKDEDKLNTNDKNKEKVLFKKNSNKMNEILNYFNESEKEIINNLKKDKAKRIAKKKQDQTIDTKDNNKYELMLRRLLEQQNIKKTGPKRRETIRKGGDTIKDMVNNILIENKNDILNNKNKKNNENNTLLISKKYDSKKGRFSVNIDRNAIFMNKLNNKKKIQEQMFKNRKTICAADILGEKNGKSKRSSKDLINK